VGERVSESERGRISGRVQYICEKVSTQLYNHAENQTADHKLMLASEPRLPNIATAPVELQKRSDPRCTNT